MPNRTSRADADDGARLMARRYRITDEERQRRRDRARELVEAGVIGGDRRSGVRASGTFERVTTLIQEIAAGMGATTPLEPTTTDDGLEELSRAELEARILAQVDAFTRGIPEVRDRLRAMRGDLPAGDPPTPRLPPPGEAGPARPKSRSAPSLEEEPPDAEQPPTPRPKPPTRPEPSLEPPPDPAEESARRAAGHVLPTSSSSHGWQRRGRPY